MLRWLLFGLCLVFFALSTIIGYTIYELFLFNVPAQVLVLNTFLCMVVWNTGSSLVSKSINPQERILPTWRPALMGYVIALALAQFGYWYAFWVGIRLVSSVSGSELALLVLAATMVMGPCLTNRYEEERLRFGWCTLAWMGLFLMISALLIRFNVPLDYHGAQEVSEKVGGVLGWLSEHLDMYTALACLVGVVMMEGIGDLVTYELRSSIKDSERGYFGFWEDAFRGSAPLRRQLNRIQSATWETAARRLKARKRAVRSYAAPQASKEAQADWPIIALIMAVFFLVVHGDWVHWPWPWTVGWQIGDAQRLFWLLAALVGLGFIGSLARYVFITIPLQSTGIPAPAVAPIMAVRLILFIPVAVAGIGLLMMYTGPLVCKHDPNKPGVSWVAVDEWQLNKWGFNTVQLLSGRSEGFHDQTCGLVVGSVDREPHKAQLLLPLNVAGALTPKHGSFLLGWLVAFLVAVSAWVLLWRKTRRLFRDEGKDDDLKLNADLGRVRALLAPAGGAPNGAPSQQEQQADVTAARGLAEKMVNWVGRHERFRNDPVVGLKSLLSLAEAECKVALRLGWRKRWSARGRITDQLAKIDTLQAEANRLAADESNGWSIEEQQAVRSKIDDVRRDLAAL